MAIKLMEGYLHLGDLNNVDDFISKMYSKARKRKLPL